MKLIKLNTDHYIIIDDSEINNGDVHFDFDKNEIDIWEGNLHSNRFKCKKITHSTRPESLGMGWMQSVLPLLLSEVKELIGKVDVEKKAEKFIGCEYKDIEDNIDQIGYDSFIRGYNQALEDNKDRKYTIDDMIKCWKYASIDQHQVFGDQIGDHYISFIKSLQPKQEWEVEFVDGKLKLK